MDLDVFFPFKIVLVLADVMSDKFVGRHLPSINRAFISDAKRSLIAPVAIDLVAALLLSTFTYT